MNSSNSITALKELLFEEENQRYKELSEKIKATSQEIDEKLANRELPESEFNEILDRIVDVMPDKLGPTITATLKVQISESRDDVVQALFPIVGQMIKRYVQQELQAITEKIDRQFEQALSIELFWLRVRSWVTGVPYSQLVIKATNEPKVMEILLVEEDSGLLMASYSKTKSFDQDMMTGMLTAIKTFVEDAMEAGKENLEMISYDSHKIYVQSFGQYYIAVVLTGVIDAEFKHRLNETIVKFVKEIMVKSSNLRTKELTTKISQYFDKI